jgi:hypothetical protein
MTWKGLFLSGGGGRIPTDDQGRMSPASPPRRVPTLSDYILRASPITLTARKATQAQATLRSATWFATWIPSRATTGAENRRRGAAGARYTSNSSKRSGRALSAGLRGR